MTVIDTYRVERRQDMGGGRFRENGALIPEAHLWFAAGHWVHTGGIDEVQVEEQEFVDAVEQYCPELAERLFTLAGITEGVVLEGGHRSPRVANMVPETLPARATTKTVTIPPRTKTARGKAAEQHPVTIRATDAHPGHATRAAAPQTLETDMENVMGPGRVYDDPTDSDPSELSQTLTNTRPEDIEAQNAAVEAAVAAHQPPSGAPNHFDDPIVQHPLLSEQVVGLEDEVSSGKLERELEGAGVAEPVETPEGHDPVAGVAPLNVVKADTTS